MGTPYMAFRTLSHRSLLTLLMEILLTVSTLLLSEWFAISSLVKLRWPHTASFYLGPLTDPWEKSYTSQNKGCLSQVHLFQHTTYQKSTKTFLSFRHVEQKTLSSVHAAEIPWGRGQGEIARYMHSVLEASFKSYLWALDGSRKQILHQQTWKKSFLKVNGFGCCILIKIKHKWLPKAGIFPSPSMSLQQENLFL